MRGEKLKMYIKGQSGQTRCFKSIKKLPAKYDGDKSAWMTTAVFESGGNGCNVKALNMGIHIEGLYIGKCKGPQQEQHLSISAPEA